ncbi:MAG: YiiD C-terminal domain-containing protein [Xanthomonadales bacterium]|nr:YiiD C-terminal domain-containing protein [Xanthomonadales bacterium]MCB1628428.1 YiiD C-terminal domain-containing protein [Xanthomonadales bacterium]
MYDLAALLTEMRASIPLAQAMDLRGASYDGLTLCLQLPLAPNINDKGCAFGGSMASAATLTGWGLVRLAIGESGRAADIYIQDQSIQYLAPLWSDMQIRCSWSDESEKAAFLARYDRTGRARASLEANVGPMTGEEAGACRMQGRYVALRPSS